MPRPSFAPASSSKFSLIILSAESKRQIAHLPLAQDGSYRASLPPGDYILDLQDRAAKHLHARPQPFTVVSNQTIQVDMNIFPALQKLQAAHNR
jgi:hypothetical protein